MGQILRVTEAFSVLSDPNGHVYTPGELVDADHPHVKGREGHFETVEAHVSRTTRSETASAAPGELRTRKRAPSRRAVAKKAVTKKAAKQAAAMKPAPEPDSPLPTGDNAPADPPSSEVL